MTEIPGAARGEIAATPIHSRSVDRLKVNVLEGVDA
jgi:hypothetical protein